MGHVLHRPHLALERLGALQVFALSTLSYGIALVITGASLWEVTSAPSWLSDAAVAVGIASTLAAPLSLLVRRWHVLAGAIALAAATAVVLGVLGTFEIIVAPAFEPNMMTWAMLLGMFSLMWGSAIYLARGLEKAAEDPLAA